MKRLHLSFAVRVLSIAVLFIQVINTPYTSRAVPANTISRVPTVFQLPSASSLAGHIQFGPQASELYIVWGETARTEASVSRESSHSIGSDDIFGLDIMANKPIVVSNAPGNQSEPALSGSLVVWQENAHSCPSCERDIVGKDLAKGTTFDVATGPTDQSHPAIYGRTVIWLDMDSKTNKLLAKNLDSGIITQIISLPLDSNISINRPVVSGEYVVWSETSHRYLSAQPGTYELRAFDLKKHSIKTVAHLRRPEPNHAVADHRVVWDDSGLHMADLNTGAISVLETFGAYAPAIKDNTVVWSARDGDSLNLWGLNLADRKPVPLVIGDGDQIGAVISGDRLVWQNEGGGNNKLITYTSLSEAFTTAPDRAKQLGSLESLNPAISSQSPLTDNPEVPGYTNPRVKGMHAANGDGWNGGTAAINALGANQTTPYFGSVLVLDTDLYRSTGYSGAPWGPEVRHAAKTLVETYGVRVIFRTVPTLVMTTTGSVNPEQVAQQVLNHAWRYWLRDIQINNEPNEEWPFSCTGCKYTYDNATYTYNFNGQFDSARLHAIGDFYWDSRLTINNYKTTHPDPNVRYNLTNNIDIWTPPMAAYYTLLSGNNNMYDVLNPMIQQYPCTTPGTTTKKCFSYHTYPTPNGYGPYGTGIRNNAWDWFSASLKTSTDNGQVRSQITEFGWDPGQLGICGYTQNSRWRGQYDPGNPDPCDAKNGQDHYFENDINLFISTYLHGAETINVWLVRGWSNASDGLDANGIAKRWLINYQNR